MCSASLACLNKFREMHPGGISTKCFDHFKWLLSTNAMDQLINSNLLPDNRASHWVSKGEPRNIEKETHFGCFYLGSYSFCHLLEPMTINEGWNVNGLVNWELCLQAGINTQLRYSQAPRKDTMMWSCFGVVATLIMSTSGSITWCTLAQKAFFYTQSLQNEQEQND